MDKHKIKNLTNEELEKLLEEAEWLDRDLLREYDERCHDGRIQFKLIPMENLEEYIHNKYAAKRIRKAS